MLNPKPTEPAFVLTYGPSGAGKTTDTGYSFPRALFIAVRGALQSLRSVCGYEPATEAATTIQDITKRIQSLKPGQYDSVVVDDFSFIAEQTMAALEKKHSGFKLWGALRDTTLDFRNAARYANCHIILNCWETGPKERAGQRVRGGPKLPSDMPEALPAMTDLTLRCGIDPMRKPWSGVYNCYLSPDYVMKDRFDVVPRISPTPMNLAEILRAVGYAVARHPDLGWQEDVVEQVAQNIVAASPGDLVKIANETYAALVGGGASTAAARWTLRDGVDRAVIRRALAARNDAFFM
jgi:hypothetical protein